MRTIALGLSLVLIFMIPWEGVVELAGFGNAAKLFGLAMAAFWVATVVLTRRLRKPGPFQIAVYLFVLWNALSYFWSADVNATVAHVVTWAQLLVLVVILWDLYTTRAALMAGLQAYVLGAYVAIGSAAENYFAGDVFYTHYQRFAAGDINPDGFGFILALGIPVAWYLANAKSTTKMSHLLKLVNYAYIPAAFLGIALSGTRTAMIAAIPGMVYGLGSLTRLRLSARVTILMFLISAVLILLPYVQPLRSFQRLGTTGEELTGGDLNQRVTIWQEGLASIPEHPLLGVGSNMYRSVNSLDKVAHNSFLSVLVEVGLIGFVLFAIILTIAVIQAWGQPKWDSRFWVTTLLVWAIGASALTWEHSKSTWLFLSLVIASAALTSHRDKAVPVAQRDKFAGRGVRQRPRLIADFETEHKPRYMHLGELTDKQWDRLRPLLPPSQARPRTEQLNLENRTAINGVLWRLRNRVVWRALPERYGKWTTVASRFYRWRKTGIWDQIVAELQRDGVNPSGLD